MTKEIRVMNNNILIYTTPDEKTYQSDNTIII